jgi:hypothetical protein
MKAARLGVVVAALLAMTAPRAYGQSELVLHQIVEPGVPTTFEHPSSIVLASGFWAKTGSDVTLSIVPQSILQVFDVVIPGAVEARLRATEGDDFSGSHDPEFGIGSGASVQVGENTKLPNPKNFYAISAIGIEEENNNPCRIILWGRMVDPRYGTQWFIQDRFLAEYALDTCKNRVVFGSFDYKDAGMSNQFIRGLQVCMGGKDPIPPLGAGFDNNEIKGLRTRQAAVSKDGAVEPVGGPPKEWTRPNCEYWASWNMCPNEQILTGLNVYVRGKEFIALGVRCMGVRSEPILQPLVKDASGY